MIVEQQVILVFIKLWREFVSLIIGLVYKEMYTLRLLVAKYVLGENHLPSQTRLQ